MDSVIELEDERIDPDSHREIIANEQDVAAINVDQQQQDNPEEDEQCELIGDRQQMISVGEQMQIMCDLYGFKQDTYWDCYREDQKDALRNKLSLILSQEFVNEKNLVKCFWACDFQFSG